MNATASPIRWPMSPSVRRTVLTVHIIASVGLLGDSAGFLAVALRAATTDDPALAASSYELLEMFSIVFGIPLSMISLATGLALGFGTKWGVLRHWWTTAKLRADLLGDPRRRLRHRSVGRPDARRQRRPRDGARPRQRLRRARARPGHGAVGLQAWRAPVGGPRVGPRATRTGPIGDAVPPAGVFRRGRCAATLVRSTLERTSRDEQRDQHQRPGRARAHAPGPSQRPAARPRRRTDHGHRHLRCQDRPQVGARGVVSRRAAGDRDTGARGLDRRRRAGHDRQPRRAPSRAAPAGPQPPRQADAGHQDGPRAGGSPRSA